MRDNRITLELFADVLDVPHRHGYTRGADVHAGRALLADVARIYDGAVASSVRSMYRYENLIEEA